MESNNRKNEFPYLWISPLHSTTNFMVEHLNERIDTMLSQIYTSEFNLKKIGSFQDYNPNQIMDYDVSNEIAQIMVEERLIN